MRTLIGAIGVLALLAGIVLLVYAFIFPQRFDLSQSTAIQAQEVYTRAIYWAVLSIASMLFGGICVISYTTSKPDATRQRKSESDTVMVK